jgi:hypothetical protein
MAMTTAPFGLDAGTYLGAVVGQCVAIIAGGVYLIYRELPGTRTVRLYYPLRRKSHARTEIAQHHAEAPARVRGATEASQQAITGADRQRREDQDRPVADGEESRSDTES